MTKTVRVEMTVEVTVDESKFTPEFMEEFSRGFYQFDSLDDHIKHLAHLHVIGVFGYPSDFIEGYGTASEMGISADIVDAEEEIVED